MPGQALGTIERWTMPLLNSIPDGFDDEDMLSRGAGSIRDWKTGAYKSHSTLVFLSSKRQGMS
jgi:hypothetical protein